MAGRFGLQNAKFLEKYGNFVKAYKQHGGLKGSFLQLFRTDEVKWGKLVGEDKYGNKYYHNNLYFLGRSRWVEYSPKFGWDYDGSQIPAEWHRWLHYIGDVPPTEQPPVKYKWLLENHKENLSGTSRQYVPYSTTRPKIESWKPPQA